MLRAVVITLAVSAAVTASHSQTRRFEITPGGELEEIEPIAEGTDAGLIAEARRLTALGETDEARELLTGWIRENNRGESPLLPEAYLARAEALIADGREFKALFDLEVVARDFPASPAFARAIEAEYDIGRDYVRGKKKRFLGTFRIEPARSTGEEVLIRVQERLPGSPLAEEAAMELAMFYDRSRRLRLASEMYEIFVANHPESPFVREARLRRILTNAARFKGPEYDATGLLEADVLLAEYVADYPGEAFRGGVAAGLRERVDESIALQNLEAAEFYLQRDETKAARFTLRRLLRDHPNTSAAQRGLEIMLDRGWVVEADAEPQPEPRPEPAAAPAAGDERRDTDGADAGAGS